MNMRLAVITAVMLFAAATALADDVLRVYGPGGPEVPMKECAAIFAEREIVRVEVVAGPTPKWIENARLDADVFYGGAEYMLTQFAQQNEGLVDLTTRKSLWIRPVGILVRAGNPKKIRSAADLAKPGIAILEVAGAGQLGVWEDLAGDDIPAIQRNIRMSVGTTADGIEAWKANPDLDAWVNFASWAQRIQGTDVVQLPPRQRIYRGTPVAVAANSDQRELALRFIAFLQTPEAHAVFRRWGWK